MAQCGISARRRCEEMIAEGIVTVNGEVLTTPAFNIDPDRDMVCVNGKPIAPESKSYYLLNKPLGYLCCAQRRGSERLVLDLFGEEGERLFTVGRLDKMTQGLLLVTNDGDFAQAIIHPSRHVTREYLVKVKEEIGDHHLKNLSSGTMVAGEHVRPSALNKVRRGTLKICLKEGKKHEVRHLVKAAGLTLLELTRIRLGPLLLGKLPPGEYRSLTQTEIDALLESCL